MSMESSENAKLLVGGRLRWACRRGMLELDLLLERFVDNSYPTQPDAVKTNFHRLLEQADQDLVGHLLGHTVCEDVELAHVISEIRRAAIA